MCTYYEMTATGSLVDQPGFLLLHDQADQVILPQHFHVHAVCVSILLICSQKVILHSFENLGLEHTCLHIGTFTSVLFFLMDFALFEYILFLLFNIHM